MSVLRFLRDFHQALADGFDMALAHLAPCEKGVRIYRYWEEAND